MVEGIEGIGEAVTGGLAARAVEPKAGEGSGHEDVCLNCGADLVGEYCHRCGQPGHVHRTLTAWWHDLAHGVLHLDGKIWRTLPLLVWRPGELTRRYVEGERARFVSPIAMFLFSVFLMFAVFSTLGGPINFNSDDIDLTAAEERAEARQEFEQEQAEAMRELDALRAERARLAAAGEQTTNIDADIGRMEGQMELQRQLHEQALALIGAEERREAEQAKQEGEPSNSAADIGDVKLGHTGDQPFKDDWFNAAFKKAKENPSLLAYKLQANAYKFSWALIPISVPFVWLLFLHRRRYRQYRVYDHTVFVTYSIAFMSLALIALSLLKWVGLGAGIAVIAMSVIPPVHMYKQLRGAYRLSRFSALWRTFVLLNFAFFAGSLFFMLLLFLGVLG